MTVLESAQRTVNGLLGRETRQTVIPKSVEEREELADEIGMEGYELLCVMKAVRMDLLNGNSTAEEAAVDLQSHLHYMEDRRDE